MAKLLISAILWRRLNKATADTLGGRSRGQYDIRLNKSATIGGFFEGLPKEEPTPLGGFSVRVPIEPYEGTRPVPARRLEVRFMGERSERQDWNIPSQRPETAYELWREGRGLPQGLQPRDDQPPLLHFAVIVRDNQGKYHARWLSPEAFNRLPSGLKTLMEGAEVGVYNADSPAASTQAQAVYEQLKTSFNVLLYGPPGTGKTFLAQEVKQLFERSSLWIDTRDEVTPIIGESSDQRKVGWVTFHQSYSYEEFVIGLRPDPQSEKMLSLKPVPGLLLELTEFARQNGKSSLLIIDEINRGNVSRIFGEFITLMEQGKRLSDAGPKTGNTVELRLPYIKPEFAVEVDVAGTKVRVPNPFSMPHRLYTLATMNSVDKTVAPMDTAIRRRFEVISLEPNLSEVGKHLGLGENMNLENITLPDPIVEANDVKRLAIGLLGSLNRGISLCRGSEYCFGQWYLDGLRGIESGDAAKVALRDIWQSKLLPQLEELFHGRPEQLGAILRIDDLKNKNDAPVYLEVPDDNFAEAGAVPYLKRRVVDSDKIIQFLCHVMGTKQATGEAGVATAGGPVSQAQG